MYFCIILVMRTCVSVELKRLNFLIIFCMTVCLGRRIRLLLMREVLGRYFMIFLYIHGTMFSMWNWHHYVVRSNAQ